MAEKQRGSTVTAFGRGRVEIAMHPNGNPGGQIQKTQSRSLSGDVGAEYDTFYSASKQAEHFSFDPSKKSQFLLVKFLHAIPTFLNIKLTKRGNVFHQRVLIDHTHHHSLSCAFGPIFSLP